VPHTVARGTQPSVALTNTPRACEVSAGEDGCCSLLTTPSRGELQGEKRYGEKKGREWWPQVLGARAVWTVTLK
jgi:hypothetical protein